MRVTFTSIEYDPSGQISLDADPASDIFALGRRVNSVATLDGSRSFEQRGFSQADREMNIVVEGPTKKQHDRLVYLFELYQTMKMYTEQGVFVITMPAMNYRAGALTIRIMIQNKEV